MCSWIRAVAAIVLLGGLCAAGTGSAEAKTDPDPVAPPVDDPTYLEDPPFPGTRIRDAVRLHFQSLFVPDAGLGPARASLYRPEIRGRVTIPLSKRAVVRVSALGGTGRYVFDGPPAFRFGGVSLIGDSLDLYQTRLYLDGAYRLNREDWALLQEGEIWSLLGGLSGSSEFESGAFSEGLSGGVRAAFGYEIQGLLRVAAGVSVQTPLGGGGVDVSPTGSLRWNVTDALTLRNHGLGLQLEYRVSPSVELFAKGYRATDHYHLRDVTGAPNDLTFRDRQLLAGAGLEWKLSRYLRVNAEAGAVAWRRVRVHSDDLGTLASQRGDPSAYFEVRFEVRP